MNLLVLGSITFLSKLILSLLEIPNKVIITKYVLRIVLKKKVMALDLKTHCKYYWEGTYICFHCVFQGNSFISRFIQEFNSNKQVNNCKQVQGCFFDPWKRLTFVS